MNQFSDSLRYEATEALLLLSRTIAENNYLTAQNDAAEAEIDRLTDENKKLRGQLMQLLQDKEIGEVLESE
jgi:cell division protein FtsB